MTFFTTDDATVERAARAWAENGPTPANYDRMSDHARQRLTDRMRAALAARGDATPTVTEWAARVTWKDGTTFEDEAESREWGEALVSSWGATDDRTAALVQREVYRTEWREVQP